MENKLDYSDKIIEAFAIRTIAASYNPIYNEFFWNKKANDFDFVHHDLGIALEVSVVITQNTQKVLSYQNSFHKDISTIKQATIDDSGRILSWYGGSFEELKHLIIKRIISKNSKAKKHLRNGIKECQLCLCVDDGGWFERKEEFDFLINNISIQSTIFSKTFIITSSLFLVYENNEIKDYQRKLC